MEMNQKKIQNNSQQRNLIGIKRKRKKSILLRARKSGNFKDKENGFMASSDFKQLRKLKNQT